MSKIKNGDRVKIIQSGYEHPKFQVGCVGTAVDCKGGSIMFCPDGHDPEQPHRSSVGTLHFTASSLELVDDTNIKVGDTVLCIDGNEEPSLDSETFYPIKGRYYTISKIESSALSFNTYVGLKEEPNPDEAGWIIRRFVKATKRKTLGELLKEKLGNPSEVLKEHGKGFTGEVIEDEVTKPNELGGVKFDLGKRDYTLLLQDLKATVDEVTDVLELGAKKYTRGNYKLIESDRYHKALLRHVMSYLSGELTDPETGKHHLAHAICCAAFLIEREVKTDETTND